MVRKRGNAYLYIWISVSGFVLSRSCTNRSEANFIRNIIMREEKGEGKGVCAVFHLTHQNRTEA